MSKPLSLPPPTKHKLTGHWLSHKEWLKSNYAVLYASNMVDWCVVLWMGCDVTWLWYNHVYWPSKPTSRYHHLHIKGPNHSSLVQCLFTIIIEDYCMMIIKWTLVGWCCHHYGYFWICPWLYAGFPSTHDMVVFFVCAFHDD